MAVTRAVVEADVVRYTAVFRVGPGPFDSIVITRVVREHAPGAPIQTRAPMFLIHGSTIAFDAQFVTRGGAPRGFAAWLASRDIDVWGIDMRFTQVPATATDFQSMSAWDFQTDIADTMLATRFARHARRLTAQRYGPLHCLGFSNGASVAYAIGNAEATLDEKDRDVRTLIPVDTVYALSSEHESERALTCGMAAAQAALIELGNLAASNAGIVQVAQLARTRPGDPSPFNTRYTNAQFALLQACSASLAPFPFHRFACVSDADGLPLDGRFTPAGTIFDALASSAPFRNRSGTRDYFAIPCGEADLPYDDNLASIRLPVLYVAVAGGFGLAGLDTLDRLGSTDVTSLVVKLRPGAPATQEFGHVDTFLASNAPDDVWTPILDWVLLH
ncbi:MAG TPA: hypothetical protein VFQ51_08855 [Vicinamibacteria bacterium]|nr:hypothetical protein [Vicinamibacteria bacterium]